VKHAGTFSVIVLCIGTLKSATLIMAKKQTCLDLNMSLKSVAHLRANQEDGMDYIVTRMTIPRQRLRKHARNTRSQQYSSRGVFYAAHVETVC
jgi:uncharacterized protein (DUF2252 family)